VQKCVRECAVQDSKDILTDIKYFDFLLAKQMLNYNLNELIILTRLCSNSKIK